jgi:S1-C subfamily serine protease
VIGVLAMLLLKRGDDGPPPVTPAVAKTAPVPKAKAKDDAKPKSTPAPEAPKPVAKEAGALTPKEIAARAIPAVAVIRGSEGSGTGFLIGKGLLATNRHVIDDELLPRIRVQWPDGGPELRGSYGVQLYYSDPDLDLAFLTVEVEAPPLPVAADATFARGEEVIAIGSPGIGDGTILQNAMARGMLSTRAVIDGQAYWQMDIQLNPGNSGGPVLDHRGHVIGVVTLRAPGKDGLGFCLPLEAVRASLDRAKQCAPKARASMVAVHRLRVTSRALLRCSRLYVAAGAHYAHAMQESMDHGENANVGLQRAMARVQEVVDRIDGNVMSLLRDEAPKVMDDRDLPETTRERHGRLWATYNDLKSHVEGPSGTVADWKEKLERLGTRLATVAGEFRLHEEIEVEDE